MFGPDSTVHGWLQRFVADGVLCEIWAELVRECDALEAVAWEWQAADGVMGRAASGVTREAQTPLIEPSRAPRST